MKKIFPLLLCFALLFVTYIPTALAQTPKKVMSTEFRRHNPDIYKYEFARSYISALSYFANINQRWTRNPPKAKFKGDDIKIIGGSMEYLVQDNADLRVAKNYMGKYFNSPNAMMRKVADIMVSACDRDIALNNQEKVLWQEWLKLKTAKKAGATEEQAFVQAQQAVELQRKETDKTIIQASILMTKVLLSEKNANDKGRILAITKKQRQQLLDRLDGYGKNVLDWGLKPGQSTLNASIAVIREILEDPVYISQK
jgi:hypothetical protein